jgi:dinuclear metal center YbgI/SA1388 family protein
MPQLAEILAWLDREAPTHLVEEWDNTGLLLGDRLQSVSRVLTCLTLTEDVAREAIDRGAQLVVSHHPIFFKAVKKLTADDAQGRMVLRLAAAGVAVYSAHTRFDSARGGINKGLAERLGLVEIDSLQPASAPASFKLVVMVPRTHVEAVRQAMWKAGAGVIGEYTECSFLMPGVGSFRGTSASNPAIGEPGEFQTVEEYRIDMVCPAPLVDQVIAAMKKAHPYEETAFDIVPRRAPQIDVGVGRTGLLPPADQPGQPPLLLGDFLERVKERLEIDTVQFSGRLDQPVRRVGIACGSAGELLRLARQRRCDVFLTGEARFHTALEARDAHIALVLAGHYATERPAMEALAITLREAFPGVETWASTCERDPLQTF